MIEALIGGLAVGAALGVLISRETICFNAGLRRAVFESRRRILRIFAVAVAAQLLLLLGSILATAMMALGALATWKFGLAPSPRLRGMETPDPHW